MTTEVVDGAKTGADVTLNADQKQTPTYTQEQLEKAVRDARSAVLADAGRAKAEAEKALRAAQDALQRNAQLEKERQERELESAKDDPAELRRIRAEHKAKTLETELARAREELNGTNSKLTELTNRDKETSAQNTVKEVAAKMGVSAATLGKLARFTDGTAEAIEELAKDLPKENPKPPLTPDNNRSHGGSSQDKYQIMKDYNSGKIDSVQYEEKLRALGLTP